MKKGKSVTRDKLRVTSKRSVVTSYQLIVTKCWLLVTGYWLLAPVVSANRVPETIVRVGILEKAASFNLGGENDFVLIELTTGKKQILSHHAILLVKASANGLLIGEKEFVSPVRFAPQNEGEFLRVNGKRYRDALLLKRNSANQITLINELGLEGYLYGILPREVGSDWPIESLKAQAVVSRTFALNNLHRHDSEGFNFCSRVHCQVYGGYDGEQAETNRAVEETRERVITYGGELANTVFFSNCGGRTEEPLNAWETNGSPPYLKSVRCRYCKHEPHYRWEQKLTQAEISSALRKNNYAIFPPIHSIRIASHGRSERAKFLKIGHSDGELKIRASHFRLALGPETIRSTLFSEIRKTKEGFYFRGRGWGHGVGMCQEGAKGLADAGANYKKIIQFYYPGTKVEEWEY